MGILPMHSPGLASIQGRSFARGMGGSPMFAVLIYLTNTIRFGK